MPEITFRKLFPLKEIALAVIIAVVGMSLLWLAGHPAEEWPAIVVVLYTSIRLAWMAALGLLGYAAKLLAGYGESVLRRVLQRNGVEFPANAPIESDSRKIRSWLVVAFVSILSSTSVGSGIFAAILAIDWLAITPLQPVFFFSARVLWFYGLHGFALLFLAPALLFFVSDARIATRINIRVLNASLAWVRSIFPEIQAQAGIQAPNHR